MQTHNGKNSKNVENGVPSVGETATRHRDLVNNGNKDEHTHLSKTTDELSTNVVSNGVRETETRDENLPAHLSETVDEQSMNVDCNGVGETPNRDQNLVKDEHVQPSESIDRQSTNMDSNGHLPNGKECDAAEETIRKLKEEQEIHVQKEAISEDTIRKLKKENDMHIRTVNSATHSNQIQSCKIGKMQRSQTNPYTQQMHKTKKISEGKKLADEPLKEEDKAYLKHSKSLAAMNPNEEPKRVRLFLSKFYHSIENLDIPSVAGRKIQKH